MDPCRAHHLPCYIYGVKKATQLLDRQLPLLMALIAAGVYATTLAPTISHTDSGELTTVCYTFGVAHPTGYPLFTLLGGLFSRIPLGSPAFMLNVLALLLTAGGVYWWGRALDVFFTGMKVKVKDGDTATLRRIAYARIGGIVVGSLLLALHRTYWVQSASAEVYSLHCFLLGLNLFLLLRAWEQPKEAGHRAWLLFAGALALAFANHLTAVTLLPGIAWLYFRKNGLNAAAFKRLGLMLALFFTLLLALYAYLPIRAAADPAYNWGNPAGTEELWHHVSGRQFSVWMFQGSKQFNANLQAYFERLPTEFAYLGLLLVLPGLLYNYQTRRDVAIFFTLNFLSAVFWASNYTIKDPEPYFLLASFSLTFWMACSLRWLWLRMRAGQPVRLALSGVAAVAVLLPLPLNHSACNQRGTWQYEDYTRAVLNSLPQDAILVSRAYDWLISPSYYVQGALGVRPDVDVIDFSMLRDRHWYPDHLRHHMPDVMQAIAPQLAEWEKAVQDFDLRGVIDGPRLTRGLANVYLGILSTKRPVYFSPDMTSMALDPRSGAGVLPDHTLVPERYCQRMMAIADVGTYIPLSTPWETIRLPQTLQESEDIGLVAQLYDILDTRIRYETQFQHLQEVETLGKLRAGLPAIPPIEP